MTSTQLHLDGTTPAQRAWMSWLAAASPEDRVSFDRWQDEGGVCPELPWGWMLDMGEVCRRDPNWHPVAGDVVITPGSYSRRYHIVLYVSPSGCAGCAWCMATGHRSSDVVCGRCDGTGSVLPPDRVWRRNNTSTCLVTFSHAIECGGRWMHDGSGGRWVASLRSWSDKGRRVLRLADETPW